MPPHWPHAETWAATAPARVRMVRYRFMVKFVVSIFCKNASAQGENAMVFNL